MMLRAALPLLTVALVSIPFCGPKDIDPVEVNSILFPAEGVLAGYDFGDSWADIKADHNEVFEVRDEAGFEQLRRDVGDNAGSNGYFVGFQLDDAGKVESISASISGQSQNAVTVRKLLDDVIAHFDKTIGSGSCSQSGGEGNSSYCDWSAPGKPSAHVSYLEFKDPLGGSLDIQVLPPAAP